MKIDKGFKWAVILTIIIVGIIYIVAKTHVHTADCYDYKSIFP